MTDARIIDLFQFAERELKGRGMELEVRLHCMGESDADDRFRVTKKGHQIFESETVDGVAGFACGITQGMILVNENRG